MSFALGVKIKRLSVNKRSWAMGLSAQQHYSSTQAEKSLHNKKFTCKIVMISRSFASATTN